MIGQQPSHVAGWHHVSTALVIGKDQLSLVRERVVPAVAAEVEDVPRPTTQRPLQVSPALSRQPLDFQPACGAQALGRLLNPLLFLSEIQCR